MQKHTPPKTDEYFAKNINRWKMKFRKIFHAFWGEIRSIFAGSKSPLDKDFCCGKFLLF